MRAKTRRWQPSGGACRLACALLNPLFLILALVRRKRGTWAPEPMPGKTSTAADLFPDVICSIITERSVP